MGLGPLFAVDVQLQETMGTRQALKGVIYVWVDPLTSASALHDYRLHLVSTRAGAVLSHVVDLNRMLQGSMR